MVGDRQISVVAYLRDYSSVTSGAAITETINVSNSCLNPFSLTVPQQVSRVEYLYTGNSPALTVSTVPFVVDPSVCPIIYTCSI